MSGGMPSAKRIVLVISPMVADASSAAITAGTIFSDPDTALATCSSPPQTVPMVLSRLKRSISPAWSCQGSILDVATSRSKVSSSGAIVCTLTPITGKSPVSTERWLSSIA